MNALIGIRAVQFTSCLILLAVPAFETWIAPPDQLSGDARTILEKRFRFLTGAAFLLALLSLIANFLLIAASLNTDAVWSILLTQTQFGRLFMLRLLLLLILDTVLFRKIAVIFSAAVLGSLAWAGHAAAGSSPFQTGIDVLHLIAAGIWPGTLLPLLLFFATVRKEHMPCMQTVTRRFSASSLIAVGILALSGCGNACFLLGSPSDLLHTRYGNLLLVKILLFLVMIGIASKNLFVLSPNLNEASAPALRRNIIAELCLATVIILIVSVLGMLPPHGA